MCFIADFNVISFVDCLSNHAEDAEMFSLASKNIPVN